jgi:DNA-binding response OmpR family regulator
MSYSEIKVVERQSSTGYRDSDQTRWRSVGTILVFSDDPESHYSICRLLRSAGYDVILASCGSITEDALHKAEPRLVILDFRKPSQSHQDVCRRIRGESRDVPLLVLSDTSNIADVILFMDLGADDYILKPLNPLEFLARVRAAIRRFGIFSNPA